jgi:hypothetical protein
LASVGLTPFIPSPLGEGNLCAKTQTDIALKSDYALLYPSSLPGEEAWEVRVIVFLILILPS